MIPVEQTKISSPTVKGNCFAACIASILEIPIEDAFEIWDYGEDNWHDELHSWLFKRGLTMCTVSVLDPGVYAIAAGASPRGVSGGHSVIWKDGECVHDPHPSKEGIVGSPWLFYLIEKIAD